LRKCRGLGQGVDGGPVEPPGRTVGGRRSRWGCIDRRKPGTGWVWWRRRPFARSSGDHRWADKACVRIGVAAEVAVRWRRGGNVVQVGEPSRRVDRKSAKWK